MKTQHWLIVQVLLSTPLLSQTTPTVQPATGTSATTNASVPTVPLPTDSALLDSLRHRLSPLEADLLRRFDAAAIKAVQDSVRAAGDKKWVENSFSGLGALIVFGWGVYQWVNQRKRDSESRLLDSLKWFEGDTQKRGLGIGVVEANWKNFPKLQPTWRNVLTGQAIYLLTGSKHGDRRDEVENLNRIMALLLPVDVTKNATNDPLKNAITEARTSTLGVQHDQAILDRWFRKLT